MLVRMSYISLINNQSVFRAYDLFTIYILFEVCPCERTPNHLKMETMYPTSAHQRSRLFRVNKIRVHIGLVY